jgi:hypothetical protein
MKKETLEWVIASIAVCKTVTEMRTGPHGLVPLDRERFPEVFQQHDDMITMARAVVEASTRKEKRQ